MLKHLFFLLYILLSLNSFSQVQVFSTNTGNRSYSTLTQAFSAINSGTHIGAIIVSVTMSHSLSTGTATLLASGVNTANYTSVIVSPSSGNITISGSANGPMILLNGADNVTFDGINSGTSSLTFTNSNTSQGHVVQLTNGASNNTITRCTLLSANTVDFWGVITFMGNTGNSNNTITYNTIGSSSSGNPTYGIIARGETPSISPPSTQYSTNVTVRYNNIYNFASATTHSFGIYILDGHSGWTIQGNKFYQTATLTLGTTGTRYHGAIWIYSVTHSGFSISDNLIGLANSLGTGTYTINTNADIYFWPITLWLSSTATSNVDGNIIRSIYFSTNATGASLSANSSFGVFSAIWARAGNINIGTNNGNVIGIGGIGGTISINLKSSATGTSPISLVNAIYTSANGLVKNNSVSGVNVFSSNRNYPFCLTGINCTGNNTEVSNNTVGSSSHFFVYLGEDTNITARIRFIGLQININGTVDIVNNTVQRYIVYSRNNTNVDCMGISVSGSGSKRIKNNTVRFLQSHSSAPFAVLGISLTTSSSANEVSNNSINNIVAQNKNPGVNVRVTGLQLSAGSAYSYCFSNQIHTLYHFSYNSVSSGADLINITGGSNKWLVHNNFLANSTDYNNSDNGIVNGSSSSEFYYNSIYLAKGNQNNSTSTCYKNAGSPSTTILSNNILFNSRTQGSNFVIHNGSSLATINSNYNLYISADTASLISWLSTARSWYNYYTTTNPNDKYSWCAPTGSLASMFMYPDTGDLRINPANANSWYINGKGIPIADIDYDWEQLNGDRSTTISDGATDIGADEVVPSVAPPAATHTGTFAAGQSSVYVFGGRTIAQIDWQTGSTLPTAQPTVLYYSGNNPPYPIPGKNAANCYWKIDATATADLNYKLKLWMSPAVMGAVPSTSDLRMAKNSSNAPSGWSCACSSTNMDANTYSFNNTAAYTSFSFFTATDNNNPLPVELLSFTATPYQDKARLTWATASEQNSAYFDIERSIDGNMFNKAGSVAAAGNSISTKEYAFEDATPITTPITYYRLKMVDADESFTYSDIRKIEQTLTNGAISVYPSPTSGTFYIAIPEGQEVPAQLELTDITGKLWLTKEITLTSQNPVRVDFPEEAAPGLYFLRVLCNGKTSLIKLPRLH